MLNLHWSSCLLGFNTNVLFVHHPQYFFEEHFYIKAVEILLPLFYKSLSIRSVCDNKLFSLKNDFSEGE